jgi:hypothetical protein
METKRLRHPLCLFFRSESHGLVTPEESQGMPSHPRLLLSVFSTLKLQLVELLQMRFWGNSWIVFY